MLFTHTVLCGLLPRQPWITDKGLIGFMEWLLAGMSKSISVCLCLCVCVCVCVCVYVCAFSRGTNERHSSFWPLCLYHRFLMTSHGHTMLIAPITVLTSLCVYVCGWEYPTWGAGDNIIKHSPSFHRPKTPENTHSLQNVCVWMCVLKLVSSGCQFKEMLICSLRIQQTKCLPWEKSSA